MQGLVSYSRITLTGIDHRPTTLMRTFTDNQGKRWQAALLDASYGNIMLVFSPWQGDGIRQQLLGVENLAEGEASFAAMDDEELQRILAKASPWNPATGSA